MSLEERNFRRREKELANASTVSMSLKGELDNDYKKFQNLCKGLALYPGRMPLAVCRETGLTLEVVNKRVVCPDSCPNVKSGEIDMNGFRNLNILPTTK